MKFAVLLFAAVAAVSADTEILLPRTKQMDRVYDDASGLIWHGQEANINDFPYMIAMILSGSFRCGASIISTTWSLSAAHCLTPGAHNPANIQYRSGSANRLSGGTLHQVTSFTRHPNYSGATLQNDVLVAAVAAPGFNNPITRPAVLPPNCATTACCEVCANVNVIVKGWGVWHNGGLPTMLQRLTQPIVDINACNAVWGGMTGGMWFCKSAVGGDSCNGDSGSPLILAAHHPGAHRQVGVVSFGSSNCNTPTQPSGNVRLEHAPIRNWIRTTTSV